MPPTMPPTMPAVLLLLSEMSPPPPVSSTAAAVVTFITVSEAPTGRLAATRVVAAVGVARCVERVEATALEAAVVVAMATVMSTEPDVTLTATSLAETPLRASATDVAIESVTALVYEDTSPEAVSVKPTVAAVAAGADGGV